MATARDLDKLKSRSTPYFVTDTEIKGLQLRVAPDGGRSWSVRYRIGKRQRRLTLGRADAIPLTDKIIGDTKIDGARSLAKRALQQAQAGIDPAETKRERREADTVQDFATIFIEQYAKKLNADGQPKKKTWKADERRLRIDILPHWRHRLMRDITRRDVRERLEAIAVRAPIVANRVRALLSKMFNVALRMDVVEVNPVSGTEKPGLEQQRDRVLTEPEIRTFWKATETLPVEMRAAFRLRLITAQRAGEVHEATWSEMDLRGGWWTIPAERSKNKLSHRVPLSRMALRILKGLTPGDPGDFIVAGARGSRQQSEAAATFNIPNFHGHDLRRTAASLMAGSGTPRLHIQRILNHVEVGVTAVYDRHGYDAEKKIALDQWAKTLTTILKKRDRSKVAFSR